MSSTRAAAKCLLRNWPTDWGPQHRNARIVCVAVLKGEQSPDFAREAFMTGGVADSIPASPTIPFKHRKVSSSVSRWPQRFYRRVAPAT
ncbi:DUF982 domain-containing protein (plasmid) [Mesorhizobium sp. AaZ16]|uniref:DUF982 domain-containing protein n=1 Tax=Mesorhizobium sp. AaZ16 TaxID=3402289 RepID=UPI00374EC405